MNELKPCPICGEPEPEYWGFGPNEGYRCVVCGYEAEMGNWQNERFYEEDIKRLQARVAELEANNDLQAILLRRLALHLSEFSCPNETYGKCVELDWQPNKGPCFSNNRNLCWLRCFPKEEAAGSEYDLPTPGDQ